MTEQATQRRPIDIDTVALLVDQGINIEAYVDRIDGYQIVSADSLVDDEF